MLEQSAELGCFTLHNIQWTRRRATVEKINNPRLDIIYQKVYAWAFFVLKNKKKSSRKLKSIVFWNEDCQWNTASINNQTSRNKIVFKLYGNVIEAAHEQFCLSSFVCCMRSPLSSLLFRFRIVYIISISTQSQVNKAELPNTNKPMFQWEINVSKMQTSNHLFMFLLKFISGESFLFCLRNNVNFVGDFWGYVDNRFFCLVIWIVDVTNIRILLQVCMPVGVCMRTSFQDVKLIRKSMRFVYISVSVNFE